MRSCSLLLVLGSGTFFLTNFLILDSLGLDFVPPCSAKALSMLLGATLKTTSPSLLARIVALNGERAHAESLPLPGIIIVHGSSSSRKLLGTTFVELALIRSAHAKLGITVYFLLFKPFLFKAFFTCSVAAGLGAMLILLRKLRSTWDCIPVLRKLLRVLIHLHNCNALQRRRSQRSQPWPF